MRGLRLIFALAPAALLPAQTPFVSPSHFSSSEGNIGISDGLGSSANQNRFLQLIKMRNGQRNINGIAIRRDAGPTGTYPDFAMIADIYVSQAAKSFPTHNEVFDVNHGANKTKVSDAGVFVFPETNAGPIPAPFDYRFTFDTPFFYPGQKPLAWEVLTHYRTTPLQMVFDAAGNWDDNPAPATNAFGTGCIATGMSMPANLTVGATSTWSRNEVNLFYTGANLPPSSTALLAVGTDASLFNGIPLPFELPGSQLGPSGACTIYNDFAITIPIVVDGAGTFNEPIPISVKGVANGTSLFSQALGIDVDANVYSSVLSNGTTVNMVRPFGSTQQISHSFVNGSHAFKGNRVSYQGLVVEVY